jgi:ABC-2 type transport system permease protein
MTTTVRRVATTPAGTSAGRCAARTVLAVARARARVELLSFVRERTAMVFTFGFPVVLLVIIASIVRGDDLGGGVDFAQYFVAGMIGAGVFGTGFQTLAIAIPIERDTGALKRLAGTPMPKSSYFLGKIAVVVVVTVVQNLLLLTIGVSVFGLRLPRTGGQWLTYLWVGLLGITACTLLGIAVAGLVRNSHAAPALVSPIAIVLQFISGVFFVFTGLPGWMQTAGAVFPLKWMTQGMRSVFLPNAYAAREPAGSWQLPMVAAVLGIWCCLGLFVAVRTFRWRNRYDGDD